MKGVEIIHVALRSLPTDLGLRPFTDISVEVDGTVYGARLHGWLGKSDFERYVANTAYSVRGRIGL